MANLDERVVMQNNIINTLRLDNAEMARAIKFLEEELTNLKAFLCWLGNVVLNVLR